MDSEKKDELMMAPDADPAEAARALVALEEETTLRAVMNRINPGDAARIVACAPGVDAQTRLIWSLDKPRRALVMDHLAPATIAALIQNKEGRNRRLLGDISMEQFQAILAFCSPAQRYYWMSQANSLRDVGANLLVLMLPPVDVAEALLTVPEFRAKVYRLNAYIPGGFESPPVDDVRLRAVLERLAVYDADRFQEVMEIAVGMVEDARDQAEVYSEIEEEPVVLARIPEVPPLMPSRPTREREETPAEEALSFLPMPLPVATDALMRTAASMLAPARRQSLQREMEKEFRDEVIADGGSLAARDLERAAARIQAYVRLGLQGVPEQPERVAEVLEQVSVRDIAHRGAVVLEQIRQVALRLRPFREVLDARQRDLLDALCRPQATMDADTGAPALLVPSEDRRKRRETIPVAQVQEALAGMSAWVATARALGMRALSPKLAEAPNGSLAVLAALAVSLVAYKRWDSQALENPALRHFRDAHFDTQKGAWRPGTVEQVRQAAQAWTEAAGIEASMRPRVVSRVMDALTQLESFLRGRPVVAWERFAPGKRPRKRRVETISLEGMEEE